MQKQTSNTRVYTAFTLIELLIVVLIIAILAAIALPNFLDFQTRSKIARVRNDMRVYAVALEAYLVDHNTYPQDQDYDPLTPLIAERGFYQLTTPIAYITTFFSDPFNAARAPGGGAFYSPFYAMGSGANSHDNLLSDEQADVQCYFLISQGPDQQDGTDRHKRWPYGGEPGETLRVYDPSNGTVSNGDLYRVGGYYRVGNWRIEDQPWESWGTIAIIQAF